MYRNRLLYTVFFILLIGLLLFFNSAYQQFHSFTRQLERNNRVRSQFQNLSGLINNAAILTPDWLMTQRIVSKSNPFWADSTTVFRQVNELKATVQDTLNRRTAARLDSIIREELPWLLQSYVPDSLIFHPASQHVVAFREIHSLIARGLERTGYLVNEQTAELNKQVRRIKLLILLFALLAGILLAYTLNNLANEKRRAKKKEKEMETVLNRISDSVVSVDRNWRYSFLNNSALQTHLLGREETLGKIIWDVHPGLKETVFGDKYQEAMQTGQVMDIESYYPPMNTWFSVKAYPAQDGLTIFYKDVTKNKKAEQQLAQTIKELEDYQFALDESSIVAITDQKGIITHANENFCYISKYTKEELIGQDHRIINSGFHSSELIKNLWVTIANGKIWKGELKNKAKDGTIYWVDTTIIPFLNQQGKPYQYIAIRSDITLRKQAEEKLIQSEKIYKTIASSIPGSVICLLDRDYRYLLIEGDMLEKLGYIKETLLGNKAAEALPSETFTDLRSDFESVFAGKTVTKESSRSGNDIISRFIPLKDENNTVYAMMIVSIDITELKIAQRNVIELNRNLEEKIRKRTEELEAFSYSVSHDLRAPLRGILGFATILEEDYDDRLDEEGKRIIGIVKNSTVKMGQLIDDLLAFSRMGKQELIKRPTDMNLLLQEVMNDYNGAGNIQWDIHPLPSINADINTMRQVWINLISNAVKYSGTKDSPCIRIGSYMAMGWPFFISKTMESALTKRIRESFLKCSSACMMPMNSKEPVLAWLLCKELFHGMAGMFGQKGKKDMAPVFIFPFPSITTNEINIYESKFSRSIISGR